MLSTVVRNGEIADAIISFFLASTTTTKSHDCELSGLDARVAAQISVSSISGAILLDSKYLTARAEPIVSRTVLASDERSPGSSKTGAADEALDITEP
jgi:hypothetical protein